MSENSQNEKITRPIPRTLRRPVEMRAFDMSLGDSFQTHSHEWGQFTYSAEGVLTVLTDYGHFTAPPAMAVWLPPMNEHSIRSVGPAKFRSIYIDKALVHGMPETCTVLSVDALLKNLILQAAEIPTEWDESSSEGRLMMVLLDRIKCAKPAPLHLPLPSDPRLRAVTRALLADPTDRRLLEQHGSNVGASGRTLARLFKRETGMTFGEWRRQRILLAALERLSENQSVTQVALELGYNSPSAFIAMFRQSLGMTPTQYLASR
jgi:AraC-like DNA-binding protein/quercetin dioxygenase-like cupin family protein